MDQQQHNMTGSYGSKAANLLVSTQTSMCTFNGCTAEATKDGTKCRFHRNRRQCSKDGCTNQVYARMLCVRHGGKKRCVQDGCSNHARGGGFCLHHGGYAVKRYCSQEGCKRQAHARQLCVRHGGGRKCRVDDCTQHARTAGLCARHSQEGVSCMDEGCKRVAQHKGIYCFQHGMERRALGEKIAIETETETKVIRNPDPIPLPSSYSPSLNDFGTLPTLPGGLPSFSEVQDTDYQFPPPLTSVYSQLKTIGRVPQPLEYMSSYPLLNKLQTPADDFWENPTYDLLELDRPLK